jgi:periplasmic copper chaperone A
MIMKVITMKTIAAYAVFYWAATAFAHVTLEQGSAAASSTYKAALRVGHGYDGAATTAVKVLIPAGFKGAKPMPKAGWALTTKVDKLAKPYDSHGKTITDDVTEVTWTASAREFYLPDAHYDEFVLRGQLPEQAGPLWFKVLQSCERGANDWSELPASGSSTKGLKTPAALLLVKPLDAAPAHAH